MKKSRKKEKKIHIKKEHKQTTKKKPTCICKFNTLKYKKVKQ